MSYDVSNYEKLKEDSRRFYENIGRVRCPALDAVVAFNAEGFNHLVYKRKRKGRKREVQMMKFQLLPRAKELVETTTTYQEYDEVLKEMQRKRRKKIVRETVVVRYWALIAIVKNRKIKVIIRQVGENGQRHFWSVIPNWTTNQYRDIRLSRTAKGNLEED